MSAVDRVALLLSLTHTAAIEDLAAWRVNGRPLTLEEFRQLRHVTLDDFAAYRELLSVEAEIEAAVRES